MIIAQLSDIHADGSERALERLEKVIHWLRPLAPDAVIVSGDLAETEQERSYDDVRARLEQLGCPYLVVPGNVDDRGRMREAFGDRFGWPEDGPLCAVLPIGGLRLIGLDVTAPGAHHGDAGPILPWLDERLNSGGDPVMIFMHQHPFFCGIDNKDRNKCRSEEALSLVIGRASDTVFGITCGHVHRPMFTRFAGLPASMAPSVTRANKLRLDGKEPEISDPPGLLIHHISEGRLVSHVVMVD
jgi:3',5'-cyclic AMP phosphodiesterase CpdA